VAYLADLLNEFRHAHLALASYNAGENRVRRWLAERKDLSPDEFVDDIPFPETQNYVKKILGSAENYRRVYADSATLSIDPNRAIPSLASRRSALK
jgi:soluble lytic murein transglycosylase